MPVWNTTGYQKLTISNSAVGLTVPSDIVYTHARIRLINPISNPVYYRDDSTDPDSDDGMPLWDKDTLTLSRNQISKTKFIRSGASDATGLVFYGTYS